MRTRSVALLVWDPTASGSSRKYVRRLVVDAAARADGRGLCACGRRVRLDGELPARLAALAHRSRVVVERGDQPARPARGPAFPGPRVRLERRAGPAGGAGIQHGALARVRL